MKRIFTSIAFTLLLLMSFSIRAQEVVAHRVSDLMDERYEIEGDAYIEQLSDGTSQLRLSEDYSTPWGPDVRIILNNSISPAGAFEVVNLTDINHFSGALTVALPPGFDIEEYNFVVFFCITFNQLWASGQFGEVIGTSGSECKTSSTFGASGTSAYDICPSDGTGDVLSLSNSINLAAGAEYVYIITDENEIVIDFTDDDFYNFEGTTADVNRVYGMNFNGNIDMRVGQHRLASGASGCFEHSSATEFLTVTKNACAAEFVCEATLTATTAWATNVEICPTDGQDDIIELRNNRLFEAGENYVYLITDTNDNLQEIVDEGFYNFEGSVETEQRVYGLHFDGTLNPAIGQNRMMTTASGCFIHSGSDLFLTITKTACQTNFVCEPSLTATTDWATSVDICPSDGQADFVELRNNLFIEPGMNYAYLITDAQGVLQEISTEVEYNFEGSSNEEQRVYGIHFSGTLNPQIGQDRRMTTATGCFEHSGDNLFLTINKIDCGDTFQCIETLTTTTNGFTEIDICANDGLADEVFLQNNEMISPGINYVFLLTDANEVLQEVLMANIYNFENTGLEEQRIYGLSYSGQLDIRIGEDRRMTSASDCFIHSGDDTFITINKTAACNTTSTFDAQLANEIDVFPNPSNGLVNIVYNDVGVQFDQVSVFDITGKKVKDLDNDNTLFIEQAGMYLIQFSNAEITTTKKLLIQ